MTITSKEQFDRIVRQLKSLFQWRFEITKSFPKWKLKTSDSSTKDIDIICGQHLASITKRAFIPPYSWVFQPISISEIKKLYYIVKEEYGIDAADYLIVRFIKTRIAFCDEWLFDYQQNITKNPNSKEKECDFLINGVKFDLKSTVLPKLFSTIPETNAEKLSLARFLYENQSGKDTKSGRFGSGNRIFIILCPSIRDKENESTNEMILALDYKKKLRYIEQFCKSYDMQEESLIFFNGHLCQYRFIFIQ